MSVLASLAPAPASPVGCICNELKKDVQEMKRDIIAMKETQHNNFILFQKMFLSLSNHVTNQKAMVTAELDKKKEKKEMRKKKKNDKRKEKEEEEEKEKEEEENEKEEEEKKEEEEEPKEKEEEEEPKEKEEEEEEQKEKNDDDNDLNDNDMNNDEKTMEKNEEEENEEEENEEEDKNEEEKNEDKDDELKEFNTPPITKFVRRRRKPKKDDSFTNPSGKQPKTNDPLTVNPLLTFDDQLLTQLQTWLNDPTNDRKKIDLVSSHSGKELFQRMLTRFTWLQDEV